MSDHRDLGRDLTYALGLGDHMVTSITLRIAVEEEPTADVTMFVKEEHGEDLVEVLRHYKLVDREET